MKIILSIWFWIYTALASLAGVVFIRNLDAAVEERDWLFYGCCSLLYPLVLFVVVLFCGHQFSKANRKSSRTFHLAVFTVVNLSLAIWIFSQTTVNLAWFPYSLIVWGICLWSSSSQVSVWKLRRCYLRLIGGIVLFLAPMVTIFYVLITGADDARLAEQQRMQESRKETVQLNARLINESLEKLKEVGEGGAELHAEYTYILDETVRDELCSGVRSPQLSQWLTDVEKSGELIESWFESEDLTPYSHSFLLFALGEYKEQMSKLNEMDDHSSIKYDLPQKMLEIQTKLRFALSGEVPADYFLLHVGDEHIALTPEKIFAEIADIQNPNLNFTKNSPSPNVWSERISALEGTVYLYHGSEESVGSHGLSHRFSVFCLGWLSMLMLAVLLYSRQRDRVAQEKLDIASTVAHEFRTPLTGMGVLIDNLLEDQERAPEKMTSYLEKMKSSNYRLHQIAEHFFIEGSLKQQNIKLETVNWSGWVTEQWEEFIALHSSETISFSCDICHTEENALLDNALLSLALQNILRNAFHYTKNGSIEISLTELPNQLGIEVRDTGIGMDASTARSVFNKYTRGEDLLSRETEGLGLGLYLAQEIAHLHDGEITVDSTLNSGSSFTLWISK